MREFHIGGTASQIFEAASNQIQIEATVVYSDLRCVELEDGNNIVPNKSAPFDCWMRMEGLEEHNIIISSK